MAAGYDGTVRIDSSIDTKGFNAGMTKLRAAATGALYAVASNTAMFGARVSQVIQNIERIGRRLLIVAAIAVVALGRMWRSLTESVAKTDAFYGTITQLQGAFDNLKGAFNAAFATLLTAALPAILTVINWLARMLTYISMIIAAFSGQTTIMQAVAGTGGEAADNADKLAKNTKKAKKEAEGALAAFDQINVLQKSSADQAETPSTGAGAGRGGTLQFQKVPIEQGVLDTVSKIKKWFGDAWAWISTSATNAWNWIKQAWADAGTFFQNLWIGISTWAVNAWNWIVSTWGTVSTWFKANVVDPLVAFWGPVWNFIKILANDAWVTLVFLWGQAAAWFQTNVTGPLAAFFSLAWVIIKGLVSSAWAHFLTVWMPLAAWLTANITTPLKTAFGTALDWIRARWEAVFSGLKNFVKGVFNGVIEVINGLLRRITNGVNGVIWSLNAFGGNVPGWQKIPTVGTPQVPYLASGAVIPPNAQFLAMLGDQKNGRNLETPETLLRQIVREELGGSGSDMTVTMPVYLDGEKIYENQKRVSRRRGASLIAGEA